MGKGQGASEMDLAACQLGCWGWAGERGAKAGPSGGDGQLMGSIALAACCRRVGVDSAGDLFAACDSYREGERAQGWFFSQSGAWL